MNVFLFQLAPVCVRGKRGKEWSPVSNVAVSEVFSVRRVYLQGSIRSLCVVEHGGMEAKQ